MYISRIIRNQSLSLLVTVCLIALKAGLPSIMNAADPPRIKILSLDSDGVLLHGSSDPAFEAAFVRPRAREWDPILPYTVVIQNKSGREIVAYTIGWRCTGRDGTTLTPVRSVFDFLGGTSLPQAGPKATQIVSQDMRLEGGGEGWSESDAAAAARLLARFGTQSSIEIGIDAVMFADGTTIGEDTAGFIPRWLAWKDSVSEIYTTTAQAPADKVKLLLQPFVDRAFATAQIDPAASTSHWAVLNVMASRAGSYEECRSLVSGFLASWLLDDFAKEGAVSLQRVRSIVRNRHLSVAVEDSKAKE